MPSPLNDVKLEALLDRLHAQSEARVDDIRSYFARRTQMAPSRPTVALTMRVGDG